MHCFVLPPDAIHMKYFFFKGKFHWISHLFCLRSGEKIFRSLRYVKVCKYFPVSVLLLFLTNAFTQTICAPQRCCCQDPLLAALPLVNREDQRSGVPPPTRPLHLHPGHLRIWGDRLLSILRWSSSAQDECRWSISSRLSFYSVAQQRDCRIITL